MGAFNGGPLLATTNKRIEILDFIEGGNCNSLHATYQFVRRAFAPYEQHSSYFRYYHHHHHHHRSLANAAVAHLECSHSVLLLLLGVQNGREFQL
jgi:hypothetical protein